jgi:hypothetical protein
MKYVKLEDGNIYAEKIKKIAEELNLSRYVNIYPRGLKKLPKSYFGEVKLGNEVSKTISNADNVVVVAISEEILDRLNEETQDFLLRSLMTPIEYDFEKDTVSINTKDMITLPLSVYQKYGQKACDTFELQFHVINELQEEEKERKAMEKELKKSKNKKKN